MEVIEIDKTEIPYRFEIDLVGEIYTFEVHYNSRFDFFTVDVEKGGEVILVGQKIAYGNPLFSSSNDPRLPKVVILPIDDANMSKRVGFDDLGAVKMFVEVLAP